MQQWHASEPPPGVPVLASWGRRFAAYLLDGLLLLLPPALGVALVIAGDQSGDEAEPLSVAGLVLIIAGITLIPGLYHTILVGNERGQTLGKRVLGLRVIDDRAGGRIGYGRAFGRWLVPWAMAIACGGFLNILDGLWPLWDDRRQTLHDKVANSVVVRTRG